MDVTHAKQLLSSVLLALSHLETSLPVFVEVGAIIIAHRQGPADTEPLLGGVLSPAGMVSCSTSFSRRVYTSPPALVTSLESFLSHFCSISRCSSPQMRRGYAWSCSPPSAWRHRLLGKEELRQREPVLFMLQGFSAVSLWGPSQSPLRSLTVTLRMPVMRVVESVVESDTKGVAGGVTKNVTIPVTENITRDITKDIMKNVTKDTTEDTTKDITKNITKDITKNITKDITKDIPETITKDTTTTIPETITNTMTFDPRRAESLRLQVETAPLRRLPLTSMWAAWRRCWRAAAAEGDRHILYNAGQRVYNQLTRETSETTGGCGEEALRSGVARRAVVDGGLADGRGRKVGEET